MIRSLGPSSSLLFLLACAAPPGGSPPDPRAVAGTPADALAELGAADHWRDVHAARDRLAAFGPEGLPAVLRGSRAESLDVRRASFEILWAEFAGDPRAVERVIAGLADPDDGFIAYGCAFHLGEHGVHAGAAALRRVLASETAGDRTRAAARKSLGELGHAEPDVVVGLWRGLAADDATTRYLSNLGMRGLVGRDLTAFGYGGPWEGAFVSGGVVLEAAGTPQERDAARAARWAAVEAFTDWLRGERPELHRLLASSLRSPHNGNEAADRSPRPRVRGARRGLPAAAASATATAAGLALPRFVHLEGASVQAGAIQRLDGRARIVFVRHLGEGEAARPPGLPVGRHEDFLDVATILGEGGAQRVLGGVVVEVSDVEPASHGFFLSRGLRVHPGKGSETRNTVSASCDASCPPVGARPAA